MFGNLRNRVWSGAYHKRLFFSSQANERSTTHRFGMTLNVCSSSLLATSVVTVSPKIDLTLLANGSPR